MIPTKTLLPRRLAHLLRRSRLIDQLHRHVDLALTLVTAPAGYGKTSLLVDFAHDAPFPVCWLSLDAADRDLHTLVEYLVSAVRRRFPEFGQTTQRALKTGNLQRNPTALAGALVGDMLEQVSEFFTLIVDDYHTVDDSAEINALLKAFLNYRPEHCHLILSSRTTPVGLPIIQLTARAQIAGVGAGHLAFTADEIQALLAGVHKIHLSPTQAEELAAESEGWITGILLSTETLWRGMRDSLARAKTQQGPIYDYLAEQVFAEQPEELRDFMLASSTLPEMNETLCQDVLGLGDVAATLRDLERRGVFVTTVVEEAGDTWYRYHHLLRDFLQVRLREQAPQRFRRLHQQVAGWFEAQEDWESAITHRLVVLSAALASPEIAPALSQQAKNDARAAAKTMDAALKSLYYAGRMETLVDWYEAVPGALRPEFPRLLLFTARALVKLGRLDDALPLVGQAKAAFAERGEAERAIFATLERVGIWYTWGRYADALALAREMLAEAADHAEPAAEARRLAGLACLNLGRPQEAVDHLRTSLALRRELGVVQDTALNYHDLSVALLRLGRLGEGWACQDKAIELYRQAGPSDQFATLLNDIANERYYLTGEYAPALTFLTEALTVARAAGAPRAEAFALLTTADLYRDLGALEQALALYTQAEEIARRLGSAELLNFAQTGIAQARLLSGDTVEALGLAVQARDEAERRKDVYQHGLSCLTLGIARLAAGDLGTALAEVEHGYELLAQGGARRDLTRAYLLLARVRQAVGDTARALAALSQALDVGIETQTFHYLVIEGQRVFGLLKQMLQQNPSDRRPAQIIDRIRALPDVAREVVGGLAPEASPHFPTLRFYGFGPGRVEKDGEPIPASTWRSALARHLIFYLLTHSPQSRDQIATTFWPDTSRDKAKAIFHAVKHQAHRALGRPLIVYEGDVYRIALEPDCWFDVAAFESLLDGQEGRQARLEQAVALYEDDFMQGHDGEWCQPLRERLWQRLCDALVELGELYTAQESFDQAFAVLGRALSLDELHEPASRALMRLYVRDGRSHAALAHFDRLTRRLRQELDTSPAPETQNLYQEIRTGTIT